MSSSIKAALRRGGVVVACSALAAVALAPAAQAHDEPDRRAKAIGAGWLNTRLDDGLLHAAFDGGSGPVGYVDYGGTVEAAYALDAVGRARLVPRITDALEESVDSYITGADFGSPDDFYAGPAGKLLSFVADLGGDADPTSFGGQNLVTLMNNMTIDDGADAGRIFDASADDFANVFGQTWAANGLLSVGSAEASDALDYLLSQQCDDGHFPTYFDTCDPAGPDATAFAVILLHDNAAGNPVLETALDDATDWLVDWQANNGGLADDNGVVNANSTGLGGWAFDLEARDRAAEKAAVWLRSLQVPGRSCDNKLGKQRGAIAYTKATYTNGRRDGIGALDAGQWQTVEAQALPALASAPSTHVKLAVDAPEHVEAGGPRVKVRVDGLAPGERACVGIGRRTFPIVGGAEGDPVFAKITIASPKGHRAVKVLTANAEAVDRIVAD